MPRPCKKRIVSCSPQSNSFSPCGSSRHTLDRVILSLDELEAVRLADLEGLYQEEAAAAMQISRQTFGNIVASAHKKIADFLVNSKQLLIQGGKIEPDQCSFLCGQCNHVWATACGDTTPEVCPDCTSKEFYCVKKSSSTHNVKCWRVS